VYFGKKEAFDKLARERHRRLLLKEIFNGARVSDLAGLGTNWKRVKWVMDAVRARVGGDEGVLDIYDAEGEHGVKRLVLEAREQLFVGNTPLCEKEDAVQPSEPQHIIEAF